MSRLSSAQKLFWPEDFAMPKFAIGNQFYVYHPPLVNTPTNWKPDKYTLLVLYAYYSFRILHVRSHSITMDKIYISNIITIDGASSVARANNYSQHVTVPKTPNEMNDSQEKTGLRTPALNATGSTYKDTGFQKETK